MAAIRRLWRSEIVSAVDQVAVLDKAAAESGVTGRYLFMTIMSAGIAVLGLLQSSPAVVIGAMLLSPLMSPIIGAGLALAVGDTHWLKVAARTLAIGTIMAIGISALIVFLSPIQTVTQEIAARTRPNLFDLLIALFSALAGAYAMIKGREGTIAGVAIATALMPPLAVVGFGLAIFNWTVFGGALMLFITNLMTIALSAAVIARFYGFRTSLTRKQSRWQVMGIVATFAVLAVPLGLSLKQIAWEANAAREARSYIKNSFDRKARLSQIDIDFDADPVTVNAQVLTPRMNAEAEIQVSRGLSSALGHDVIVHIDQYRVGTDPAAAEQAELATARAKEQADALNREVSDLSEQLALVAGVSPVEVLVDRDHRRAQVRARYLEGAGLASYRALERRIGGMAPQWDVRIIPPARPLPNIEFGEDGKPDQASLQLVAWAAKRLDVPIEISGNSGNVAKVGQALKDLGLTRVLVTQRAGNEVQVKWSAPSQFAN